VRAEIVATGVEEWAGRIRAEMAKGVEAVIATGRALIECKAQLPTGQFEQAVRMAGMDPREARKFMAVAAHPVIANRVPVPDLPSGYSTLYELSRIEPGVLEAAIAEGVVRADMTRAEAKRLRDPEHVETSHKRKNDPANRRWVCPVCNGKGYVTKEPRQGFGRARKESAA